VAIGGDFRIRQLNISAGIPMRRSGKRNVAVVSKRVSRHEGMPTSDEICEDCGALVAEPNAPHTRRDCEKCGKQRFGTAGPEGVKTEPGDTFVIPAGFLTMSLDPTQSNGRLMRPGMTCLVREGFLRTLQRTQMALD